MEAKQFLKGIKRVLFSALLLAAFTITAKAQRRGGDEAAFDVGSKTLGLSLGVGDEYSYGNGYNDNHTGLPAFAVTYDQGVFGDVGPGTIGIGGIAAWQESYYKSGDFKATWTTFLVGVRGSYHLTILKDRNNKFDPYAGVTLGARINNYHDNSGNGSSNSSDPVVGAFIGAKYNFAQGFGVFGEAAVNDISVLRAGIAFNF